MAQHDYVIDNSTGANVRADLNSALQAIASNNSGSSAPSTTYAFQLFADTNLQKIRIRNSANNAYVNLRGFDGSIQIPGGSQSSPSLFLTDDTNTGIFSGGPDEINISTGGTERFVITSSGNCGIGTVSPAGNLHIQSTGDTVVRVTSADGNGAFLDLGDVSDPDGGRINYDNGSNLVFHTSSSERLRIKSNGFVGIGTNSPNNKLHVRTESGEAAAVRVATFSEVTNQEFILLFRAYTNATGGIRRAGTSAGPEFFSSSDRRLKTNIVDMDNVLDKIKQLSIKKFDYKDGTASGIGLIAQDLINIFPDKVTKDSSDDGTGDTVPDNVQPWTVGHNFTFELLKAVQELTARVEALEAG